MRMHELYASITASIIKDLEAGTATWVRPWSVQGGGIMPRNYATKRFYSGINVVILWDSQIKNGYPTSEWLT
jgi:antirestriction protein ArdC